MKSNHHPRVEMITTTSLTANPRNARLHPEKQIRQLAAFMKKHGFRVPISVDQHNLIVAGHGRHEAAKLPGLTEVPVIRTHFQTEAERNAFALADNRLGELSRWDDDILKAELENLFEGGFDISTIGFSTADLDFAVVEEKVDKPAKVERVDLPAEGPAMRKRPGLPLSPPNLQNSLLIPCTAGKPDRAQLARRLAAQSAPEMAGNCPIADGE